MAQGGSILSEVLLLVARATVVGVDIRDLDRMAEEALRVRGATPSFKGYVGHPGETPFPSTLCVSINDEVVHGRGDRPIVIQDGMVVSLDIGCWFQGLCTDMATTVLIGNVSEEVKQLREVTHAALLAGIQASLPGVSVQTVSRAISDTIRPHGYGVVRDLVGHGVGHAVHESPQIPNFIDRSARDVRLEAGMCVAIEPMVTLGGWEVETGEDGWAVVTSDGSTSAHIEATIAITDQGPQILTPIVF